MRRPEFRYFVSDLEKIQPQRRNVVPMRNKTTVSFLMLLLMGLLGLGCQATGRATTKEIPAPPATSPLAGSEQILLVVTETWASNQGRLRRFERTPGSAWRPVGKEVPVNVGRNGLGWGRGLHGDQLSHAPVKAEGDGRAPAGVFALPGAFAYQPAALSTPPRVSVYPLTDHTVCVDSTTSRFYNRTFEETAASAKDWNSEERMLRPDGLYRFGLFVDHNTSGTKPGAGSCIFMHLWRGPGSPTAGCTAMAEPDMLTILAWLDAGKKPLLVQLPRPELARLAQAWGAPELAQ